MNSTAQRKIEFFGPEVEGESHDERVKRDNALMEWGLTPFLSSSNDPKKSLHRSQYTTLGFLVII